MTYERYSYSLRPTGFGYSKKHGMVKTDGKTRQYRVSVWYGGKTETWQIGKDDPESAKAAVLGCLKIDSYDRAVVERLL